MKRLICSLILIALTACEKAAPKPDPVLLRVGNGVLTSSALDFEVGACVTSVTAAAAKKGKLLPADKLEKFKANNQAMCLRSRINYLLMTSSTNARSVAVSNDMLEKHRNIFSSALFGRPGKFDELAQCVDASCFAAISNHVYQQAFCDEFVERHYARKFAVTPKDVEQAWSNVVAQKAWAAATNVMIYALAERLVRMARDGADFAKLADQYSQDPDKLPGGFYDIQHKEELDFDKAGVKSAIAAMRTGDVSEPLDSEDGLVVFKADSVTPCQCEGHEFGSQDYRLRRIVLHRALPLGYKDMDEVGQEIRRQKSIEMWKRIIADLTTENPLSFPSGFDKFSPGSMRVLAAYSKLVPQKRNGADGQVPFAAKPSHKHQEAVHE